MRRMILLIILTGILTLGAALPTMAGSATISGYLGSSNMFPSGRFYNGSPCTSGFNSSGTFYYTFRQIQVTASGSYTYKDYGVLVNNDGIIDAYVGFYTGSPSTFDPTNPYGNGCVAIWDDNGNVTLTAGVTYTLVVSSYEGSLDSHDGDTNVGNYQFTLNGPGEVNVLSTAGVCTNPLPSSGAAVLSIPNSAPSYWAANLQDGTNFNLPAGTWWVINTSGDFAEVWISCQANPVWVLKSAIVGDLSGIGETTVDLLHLGVVRGSGDCPFVLPTDAVVESLPNGASAYFAPDLKDGANFNIPAGTWWVVYTYGDFSQLWISCQADPVWVLTKALTP